MNEAGGWLLNSSASMFRSEHGSVKKQLLESENGGKQQGFSESLSSMVDFFGEVTQTHIIGVYGCFLKWWYPTTMGFPAKTDHFAVLWGYHHFRKHPYISEEF